MDNSNVLNFNNLSKTQNRFSMMSLNNADLKTEKNIQKEKKNYTFHKDFDKPIVLIIDEQKDFTDVELRKKFDLDILD